MAQSRKHPRDSDFDFNFNTAMLPVIEPAIKRRITASPPTLHIGHNAEEATLRKQLTDSIPEDIKNSHVMKAGIGDLALFGATIQYIRQVENEKEDLRLSNLEASRASMNRISVLEKEEQDWRPRIEAAAAWEQKFKDLQQTFFTAQGSWNLKVGRLDKKDTEIRESKEKLQEKTEKLREKTEKVKAARKALMGA